MTAINVRKASLLMSDKRKPLKKKKDHDKVKTQAPESSLAAKAAGDDRKQPTATLRAT